VTFLWPLLLSFLAVAVGVISVYSLLSDMWLRDRRRTSERVDDEFLKQQRERVRGTSLFKDLGRMADELASEEPRLDWRHRLKLLIEQAGMDRSLYELLIATIGTAVFAGLALGLLLRSIWAFPPAALLGAAVPLWYVVARKKLRLKLMMRQLPDAFDSMARVLRAGHTLAQSLQMIVRDFDQPLAGEFAYCYEQQNLGLSPEASYEDLASRIDLFEVRIFALAMSVQQQTGGNVAELLDKLATGVRDRQQSFLRMQALTGESRMQAKVLIALPLVVFGILWVLKRSHAEKLLGEPKVLLAALAAQLLGALWIRAILRQED
jgi:tight adherence protein B